MGEQMRGRYVADLVKWRLRRWGPASGEREVVNDMRPERERMVYVMGHEEGHGHGQTVCVGHLILSDVAAMERRFGYGTVDDRTAEGLHGVHPCFSAACPEPSAHICEWNFSIPSPTQGFDWLLERHALGVNDVSGNIT